MKKLKIITGEENPILRAMSLPVRNFDSALKKFAKQMRVAMEGANGLGIAAPQVGVNERIFLTTLGYKKDNERLVAMVNPEILEFGEEMEVGEEGCLSLPKVFGDVERPKMVKVSFYDLDGAQQVLELEGLDARVVQHETDHLDGVLFVDRVGS